VPSDLPLRDLLEPVGWTFLGLAALNIALFAALVVQREQWVMHQRVRGRIGERLAPLIERLLAGGDAERAAEELRPVIADLGSQARPVAAWLLLDGLRDADAATRAAVTRVLRESGAIERAERSIRRRVPWRRALACELVGTIGTEQSVDVLVARLRDRRGEVHVAAAGARAARLSGGGAADRVLPAERGHPDRRRPRCIDASGRSGNGCVPAGPRVTGPDCAGDLLRTYGELIQFGKIIPRR
jgi:hypothetical protein